MVLWYARSVEIEDPNGSPWVWAQAELRLACEVFKAHEAVLIIATIATNYFRRKENS